MLAVAAVMFAIEFVADKVPLFDSVWDVGQTFFRPADRRRGIGVEFAGADGDSSFDQALAGGGTGALALVSHGVKASLRLGINASPEPFTNIVASVGEDLAVGAVTALALAAAGARRGDRRRAAGRRDRAGGLRLEADPPGVGPGARPLRAAPRAAPMNR